MANGVEYYGLGLPGLLNMLGETQFSVYDQYVYIINEYKKEMKSESFVPHSKNAARPR